MSILSLQAFKWSSVSVNFYRSTFITIPYFIEVSVVRYVPFITVGIKWFYLELNAFSSPRVESQMKEIMRECVILILWHFKRKYTLQIATMYNFFYLTTTTNLDYLNNWTSFSRGTFFDETVLDFCSKIEFCLFCIARYWAYFIIGRYLR